MSNAIVECKHVWKQYGKPARGIKELLIGSRKRADSRYSRNWALQDVNFEVPVGAAFGIVGHNGTGKSTLLSLLLGTMRSDQGEIVVNGRMASLLELGAGFHPELSGRENIFLYGSILGMTMAEIRLRYEAIVAFSEMEGAIDNPIRTYSNGMITRLGFSIIIHTPADILLIDEVLAVGDSRFQTKCRQYLHEFKGNGGTLVIVSHDMESLSEICDIGICMELGKIIYRGAIDKVIENYKFLMQDANALNLA